MPAAIGEDVRAAIVYHAALGYSNREVAEEVGVSRNTVGKYLERARAVVETAEDPRATLCAILENEYDWERGRVRGTDGLGFISM